MEFQLITKINNLEITQVLRAVGEIDRRVKNAFLLDRTYLITLSDGLFEIVNHPNAIIQVQKSLMK